MSSSISALAATNVLTMRQLIAAAPILSTWRNSKGRLMPLHIKSAPGMGKNMVMDQVIRAMARANPGRPVGLGIVNPGVMTPADAAGYVLFDTVDGQKTSVYTRPTLFAVRYALIYDPNCTHDSDDGNGVVWEDGFRRVKLDDAGQPLYVGSTVFGQRLTMGYTLMDEFDQGDLEVRKVMAPLFDEGRMTTHTLPQDWGVWAASNRAKDASGTGRGLAFLTNRWCAIEVTPDVPMLRSFMMGQDTSDAVEMVQPTMVPAVVNGEAGAGRIKRNPADVDSIAHPASMAYLDAQQEVLYEGVPSDPNLPFATPRSYEAVNNLFDCLLRLPVADESGRMDDTLTFADSFVARRDAAPDGLTGSGPDRWALFSALASGTFGSANAAQFAATLELFTEVPTNAMIAANPTKCHVSPKRDAQFIVGYQMAAGMTAKTADALLTYAERLDPAIYHNVVYGAVSRDCDLLVSQKVRDYMQENPDVMMRMMTVRAAAKQPGRKVA